MKNKLKQFGFEFIAWSAFIIFPLILFPTLEPFMTNGSLNGPVKGILITHSLLIVFFYFNYYYAIPKYYFTKKYSTYFPLILVSVLVIVLIMLTDKKFNPLPSPPFRYASITFIASIVLRFAFIFILSLGIASYRRLKQTEQEKLKTELSFLKAQINPHFLFNTLNSIYALTVKKSDAAPESITKLSAIMRYSITEAAHDFVALDKELNYISAYIELEKLRITEKVKLTYKVDGATAGKQIAPQIFIPLIENAFKYGVSTQENSEINISIALEKNKLTVEVKNTKVRADNKTKSGLGIENTKRRLNLLYPGKHTISIKDNEKEFLVKLELVLND